MMTAAAVIACICARKDVGEHDRDRRTRRGARRLKMDDAILFYSTINEFGEFSNFAEYRINLDGKTWPTTEHYFQAKKFPGTPHEDEIRRAARPNDAARMGRQRSRPLRRDWESVKEDVMRRALRAKFTQHPELGALLISTGDRELVEHTTNDRYWGDGGDGSGKNRLGALLMELRAELIAEAGEGQGR
jgi:ribA/ribD-fused uncharacterized protein